MATEIVKMDQPEEKKTRTVTTSHRWSIEHFDVFARGQCGWKSLVTGTFTVMKDELIKFVPTIEVKEKRAKKWLAVGVGVVITDVLSWWEKETEWRGAWSVEDGEGKRVMRTENKWKILDTTEIVWKLEYIAIEDLLAPDSKLLIDGKLVLHCEVTLRSAKPIFLPSTASPPSTSFINILAPLVTLSHRFSLAHFSLCYNQDECCPMFFESDYFAPEVELLGRFKMRVYPKRLSIVEANMVEIVIINEAYSGTGYIKMALLKKDGQLYTVQGGVAKFTPKNVVHISLLSRQLLLDPVKGLLPGDILTVDCQLILMVEKESNLQHYSSSMVDVSQYQIHQAQITWSIEQFREKHFERTERLESESFKSNTTPEGYSFRLHLYSKDNETEDDLVAALYSEKQPSKETAVQLRISIVDREKGNWCTIPNQTSIFKPGEYAKCSLIPRSILLAHSDRTLPNDTLTLICQLWIIESPVHLIALPPPSSWETMLASLNTSNAAEYFYLAHRHRLPRTFKEKIFKQMRDNREAVIRSEGWKRYIEANPELFGELFRLF